MIRKESKSRTFPKENVLYQQVLQTRRAAVSPVRELLEDVHDGREDVTTFVGKQGRSLDMVHLRDLMV